MCVHVYTHVYMHVQEGGKEGALHGYRKPLQENNMIRPFGQPRSDGSHRHVTTGYQFPLSGKKHFWPS